MLQKMKDQRFDGGENGNGVALRDACFGKRKAGLKNFKFFGPGNSLSAVVNIELAVDAFEMGIYGMR